MMAGTHRIGEQESANAAGDGQQQTLHHELMEKLPAACAKRDAHSHFTAALRCPHQQQI